MFLFIHVTSITYKVIEVGIPAAGIQIYCIMLHNRRNLNSDSCIRNIQWNFLTLNRTQTGDKTDIFVVFFY